MYNPYEDSLKTNARKLRKTMTREELLLWSRLRRSQVLGIKFLRQKPLFGYIVDFYALEIKLGIEVDGSQHYEESKSYHDQKRDLNLKHRSIRVLRYSNRDINTAFHCVMDDIYNQVRARI